jgi:hypothetical protein
MYNRLQPRARRTFDGRKDMMASRARGRSSPASLAARLSEDANAQR